MTYTPKNPRVTFGYDYYRGDWVGKLRSRDELNLVRREVKKKMAQLIGVLEDDPFHYVYEWAPGEDGFDESVAWQITDEHLANVRSWAEQRWAPFGSFTLEDCRGKTCTVVGTAHITGTQFELHERTSGGSQQVLANVLLDEATQRVVDVPLYAFISYDCEPDDMEPAAPPNTQDDPIRSILGDGSATFETPNEITSETEADTTSRIWPPIDADPTARVAANQPITYRNLSITLGYDYVRGDWIEGLTEAEMDHCRREAQKRIRCDLEALIHCPPGFLQFEDERSEDAAIRRVEADREAARELVHATWGSSRAHLRAIDPVETTTNPIGEQVRSRRPLKLCTYNCRTGEHKTSNVFELHRTAGNGTTPIAVEVTLPSGKVRRIRLIVSVEYDCVLDPSLISDDCS